MKFKYNQSDRRSNIFTKFDQNPSHSKRDIRRKSGTNTQIDRHTDKVCINLQSRDCNDKGVATWSKPLTISYEETRGIIILLFYTEDATMKQTLK